MTNAATRIGTLFDDIQKGTKNEALDSAIARRLHVKSGSPDYFFALTSLQNELQQVELSVNATVESERQRAVYMRSIQQFKPYLNPIAIASHTTSKVKAMSNDIDQLLVIGEKLPNELERNDEAKLQALLLEVEGLKGAIDDLGLAPDIELHLKTLINTLIMALRSHTILGPQGLARAFGSVASELCRTANIESLKGTASPKAASWFGQTVKTLKAVGAVVVWAGALAGAGSELVDFAGDVGGLLGDAPPAADK